MAHLPLHYGKAPSWLFQRMKKLAREITISIVDEWGSDYMLTRLSDPFWFQALGCVLGFDWHSSGLTTTVCGALKEGIKGLENELGLFIAGGKGKSSRKTPSQIEEYCQNLSIEPDDLVYASKMSAKVDNTALQDGYQLYHHTFFFNREGTWSVIQQGMNEDNRYARRYHWQSKGVENFVCEPHEAICCDVKGKSLNMVAHESEQTRQVSTLLSKEKPDKLILEIKKVEQLILPKRHDIKPIDLNSKYFEKILIKTYENQPDNFEALLGIKGVGPKTIRTLSLISELVYGAKPSFLDPARFSFSHGGKDGHPYPVDRNAYDIAINFLNESINKSKIDNREKREAFKRLSK
ncbi:MAG: DUF763 domain-containing protein, partial [Deltaproteobacteria bacterium]|nr:DUF763 domain-containing protein [Deltaproteobacteria bacterium]